MLTQKKMINLFLLLVGQYALADEPIPKVEWGGFVDTQYAYDFNAPANGDRAYTTQAARHNEFNINLGYIEAKVSSDKIKGRFALQTGTSVQSNYSSEPRRGSVSGGDLSRHIQEANLGYSISDKTKIETGIFFSHIGAETWISKDNLVLTRSLIADYTPYYLSGVKLTHSWTERLNTQLLLVNGWQIISENNTDKSIGTVIEYSFEHFVVSYNTLLGNEVSPDLNGSPRLGSFRHYHDLIIKSKNYQFWEFAAQIDTGFQKKLDSSDYSQWQGASLMFRYKLDNSQKISFRGEFLHDPDQIVVVTGGDRSSMTTIGGSLGFDQTLESNLLWRNELRYLKANNNVFTKDQNTFVNDNCTLTTSLALSF